MRIALLMIGAMVMAGPAHAQRRSWVDRGERRGLHYLVLPGFEYEAIEGSSNGKTTSVGVTGRVQSTSQLFTAGTARVAGLVAVELGYGKLSQPVSGLGKSHMSTRFELGLGASLHVGSQADVGAYVYGMVVEDPSFMRPLMSGASGFRMLKVNGRTGRLYAEAATSVGTLGYNTTGSMLDVSVWHMSDHWGSLGLRFQQRRRSSTGQPDRVLNLIGLQFGLMQ